MRGLVEGECGGANPLVQWSTRFLQDKPVAKGGVQGDQLTELTHHGSIGAVQQWTSEFLADQGPMIPQSFNMSAILREAQCIEQTTPLPLAVSRGTSSSLQESGVQEWVEQFASQQPVNAASSLESEWVNEFSHHQNIEAKRWADEFSMTEEERWVEEFQQRERSVDEVARELVNTVQDPDIQATEFMDFVKKLGSGELKMEDGKVVVTAADSKDWASEFERNQQQENFWDRMESEWQEMARQEQHPWLSEFNGEATPPSAYSFTEDNPLKDTSNPLEEGLRRLQAGDLPGAVLLFEAEVQARPQSIKGWQYLGTTQADNEQEHLAITALNKCLELDPSNLSALLALAVSYTNESQQNKALDSLVTWLRENPRYRGIVDSSKPILKSSVTSFMTKESHAAVTDLYIKAAQLSPHDLDPDVQVGLGVLFNLSSEYAKAVDCFSAALKARPEDAMLWNKLGATLANSNRSEEAIHAYRQALHYLPGFTRSRYNLGISCINLKAYREAIEHLLTALNVQRRATGPANATSQMSEAVWSTLRLAVSLYGRNDLIEHVNSRNLDFLTREFGID